MEKGEKMMEIARKDLPSYLYILRCVDNGLYIGIATDIEKRLNEHREGKGSRYTKTRLPVKLVYVRKFCNRNEAIIIEKRLKVYTRERKERLIKSFLNKWKNVKDKSIKSAIEITEGIPFPSKLGKD